MLNVVSAFGGRKELEEFSRNPSMKKPDVRGPSPAEKARKALGEKLNRPPKPPPTPSDNSLPRRPPPSKRLKDTANTLGL
jgi:hypothetical protein